MTCITCCGVYATSCCTAVEHVTCVHTWNEAVAAVGQCYSNTDEACASSNISSFWAPPQTRENGTNRCRETAKRRAPLVIVLETRRQYSLCETCSSHRESTESAKSHTSPSVLLLTFTRLDKHQSLLLTSSISRISQTTHSTCYTLPLTYHLRQTVSTAHITYLYSSEEHLCLTVQACSCQ